MSDTPTTVAVISPPPLYSIVRDQTGFIVYKNGIFKNRFPLIELVASWMWADYERNGSGK